MPEFLAEQYQPGDTDAGVRTRAAALQRACEELAASGVDVKVVSSYYVPSDEVVFFQLAAESVTAVEEAGRTARMVFDRVSETVSLAATTGPGAAGRTGTVR